MSKIKGVPDHSCHFACFESQNRCGRWLCIHTPPPDVKFVIEIKEIVIALKRDFNLRRVSELLIRAFNFCLILLITLALLKSIALSLEIGISLALKA